MKVKKFDPEKDNPDHVLGVAYRDYFTGELRVFDHRTGVTIRIIEEK